MTPIVRRASTDTLVTIIAIDPSTDVTGLAVVSFNTSGCPSLQLLSGIRASARRSVSVSDSDTERFARIAETRRVLSGLIASLPCAVDLVAWEVPPPPLVVRGAAVGLKAYAAIQQAIGAYLSVTPIRGIPALPVHVPSCKAVYGNLGLSRAANADKASKEAKRALLKANAIRWANETFALELTASDDGQADALSVACAAFKIWYAAEAVARTKAANPPLFGPGSRPRKPKTAEVTT